MKEELEAARLEQARLKAAQKKARQAAKKARLKEEKEAKREMYRLEKARVEQEITEAEAMLAQAQLTQDRKDHLSVQVDLMLEGELEGLTRDAKNRVLLNKIAACTEACPVHGVFMSRQYGAGKLSG